MASSSALKIVFLDSGTLSIGDIDFAPFKSLGEFLSYDRTSSDQVVARSQDADILITNKVSLDKEILSGLPKLKYICVAATGYNVVDVAEARLLNIPVSNVSGYSTSSVAQHVFAMILASINRVAMYSKEVVDGRWQNGEDFTFYDHSITELAGKTLGIFGYGTIGKAVANIGRSFGMEIIATKRSQLVTQQDDHELVMVEELCRRSDVISLHAPLTDATKSLFNYELLSIMKSSAILVNTARGALINENDLCKILSEGKIAFACLDVLDKEPPTSDNPLIGLDNCMITPHQAWASLESRTRLRDGLIENITAFANGEELKNLV